MRGVRRIAALLAGFALVVGAVFFALQLLHSGAEAGRIVGLVVGLLAVFGAFTRGLQWLWRQSRPEDVGRPSAQQLDDLAAAVRDQWEEEATRRKLLAPAPLPIRWAVAGPELGGRVDGAVGVAGQRPRFETLPGLHDITGQMLRSGGGRAELHQIYGSVASGRVAVVGEPGVGKTGAGIMLVLDALAHRAQLSDKKRTKVPVPVMFTLADWDPRATSFEDWLEGKIATSYYAGQSGRPRAKALVDNGQVAVIVDGLDEINAELRPIALEAMSAARVRLVLLTRTEEMATAARTHQLVDAAVVELCAVEATAAADYLNRSLPGQPPAHWNDLLDELRSTPDGSLATSLRTPLTLTLVRDTYRVGDDVRGLLDASHTLEAPELEAHLLDRIITAAYTPRPGEQQPPYPADVAARTLALIAGRMSQDGTRDLGWWHLRRWAPRGPRLLVLLLAIGLVIWLAVTNDYLWALPFWAAVLAFGGLGYRIRGRGPHRVGRLRWGSTFTGRALAVGLTFGLTFGLAFGYLMYTETNGWALGWSVVIGFSTALVFALLAGLMQPETEVSAPVAPVALWRSDQRTALLLGCAFGTLSLIIFATAGAIMHGTGDLRSLVAALVAVPVAGLVAAAFGWLWSVAATTRLAMAELTITHRTPVRLLRFLEDARSREVLRTVGSVYQFRHARLQDRLATQTPADRRRSRLLVWGLPLLAMLLIASALTIAAAAFRPLPLMSALAVTEAGTEVVGGSQDGTVKVWNVVTGEEKSLTGHTDWVSAVAVAPDPTHVVSGSDDGTVKVWNVVTGEEKTLTGPTHTVSGVGAVAVTPDATHVVIGSGDGTVKVWNVVTGEEKTLTRHTDWVSAVAVTPDASHVVSGWGDGTVMVWNVVTGEEKTLTGHTDRSVSAVAVTADGKLVVSGSDDGTVKVWDLTTNEEQALQ
jgi:hypothetical protein